MKKSSFRRKFVAITPFICLIAFFILGYFGYWHPGWLVFFLIPIVPIILGTKKLRHVYWLICLGIYLLMGFILHWWHPGWVIFFTIPIVEILFSKSDEDEDEDEDDEDRDSKVIDIK